MDDLSGKEIAELASENRALRRAITTLHHVANLVRDGREIQPTCYALLTGVTAGIGLGLNRAMLFLVDQENREHLCGIAAVGPEDGVDADRVWRSIDRDEPDLDTLYRAGLAQRREPGPLDETVRRLTVPIANESPMGLAMRHASAITSGATDDLDGLLDLQTAIAAPLRSRRRMEGVLYADNRFTGEPVSAVVELVFTLIADQAGRAIHQATEFERLAARARSDALTGLGHHGSMMESVDQALAEAGPTERVGLAMIDLDDFKLVNDTHGHLAGDALLAAVASRLRAEVRSSETPFRYGGEEFAVLLGDVDDERLLQAGQRLHRVVSSTPYAVGADRKLAVTCSVGLAAYRGAGGTPSTLIEAADNALFAAKEQGKNRVVLAGPVASSAQEQPADS